MEGEPEIRQAPQAHTDELSPLWLLSPASRPACILHSRFPLRGGETWLSPSAYWPAPNCSYNPHTVIGRLVTWSLRACPMSPLGPRSPTQPASAGCRGPGPRPTGQHGAAAHAPLSASLAGPGFQGLVPAGLVLHRCCGLLPPPRELETHNCKAPRWVSGRGVG